MLFEASFAFSSFTEAPEGTEGACGAGEGADGDCVELLPLGGSLRCLGKVPVLGLRFGLAFGFDFLGGENG